MNGFLINKLHVSATGPEERLSVFCMEELDCVFFVDVSLSDFYRMIGVVDEDVSWGNRHYFRVQVPRLI